MAKKAKMKAGGSTYIGSGQDRKILNWKKGEFLDPKLVKHLGKSDYSLIDPEEESKKAT